VGVEISHDDGVVVFLIVQEMGDVRRVSRGAGSSWRDIYVVKSVGSGVYGCDYCLVLESGITWEMEVRGKKGVGDRVVDKEGKTPTAAAKWPIAAEERVGWERAGVGGAGEFGFL